VGEEYTAYSFNAICEITLFITNKQAYLQLKDELYKTSQKDMFQQH
jgi:hypothetical protein